MKATKIKTSRLASFLVAGLFFAIVLLVPAQYVFAFSGTGSGTSPDPYIITNCVQLQDMASNLAAHYKLGNNIDCSDTVNWNGGKGFDPVGVGITYDQDFNPIPAVPFTGSLDGAGHTVSNITILRANDTPNDTGAPEDEWFVGLFGATENATVQNVHVRDSKIKGYRAVGGIIGEMTGGTLTGSSFNTTTADNSCNPGHCVWARYGDFGGGLVGDLVSGTITDSRSGGPVKGSGFEIGGLVGYMDDGTISNSSSTSNTDGGVSIGGAIGQMNGGTATKVFVSGNAQANIDEASGKSGRNVGGFVGVITNGTITDSYATGTATADYGAAGGFIGYMANGQISRSYSSGAVSVSPQDFGQTFSGGGFIGSLYGGTVQDSFTVSEISVVRTDTGGFVASKQDGVLTNDYFDVTRTGKDFCYGKPTSGSGNGEFNNPLGVAHDASGNLYVTDSGNNRVQKFSSSGTYITQWGTSGTGNGEFTSMSGIAVDSSNNVYVFDVGNNRIEKFDSSGNYLTQWGSEGSGDGQFEFPYGDGLAVDSSDNVYAVDGPNGRVQKFSSAGAYITQWGTFGSANGEFISPQGITVDSSNNVYVADSGNNRVQKFSNVGAYISQFGSQGQGDGEFSNGPTFLALDSSNNIYVTDGNGHRVEKFNSSGSYVSQWGSEGSGDGQFEFPYGITVNTDGNVVIVDSNNARVQKFSSTGTYISQWGGLNHGNTGCTAINASNADPNYFFNAAHEPFAGSWDASVWSFSSNAYPVLHPLDQDNDGIPNSVEDGAPNNGDGNNDGILDATQSNVASFVDSVSGEYVTLVAPAGVTITTASTSTATSDGSNHYKFGLVGFTITGITSGSTAPISIFIPTDDNPNSFTARKYKNGAFSTIDGAAVTATTIGGQATLHLSYNVTDGGNLDTDGSANGSITDPVGLASGGSLATTGANQTRIALLALGLMVAGFAGLNFSRQKVKATRR
jgi:sugar lactone lactonase YvrE